MISSFSSRAMIVIILCRGQLSEMTKNDIINMYSRVWNKYNTIFIIFWNFFSRGYSLIKDLKDYKSLHILGGNLYSFCQIFQRLHLFKGLCLFRTLEYLIEKECTGD